VPGGFIPNPGFAAECEASEGAAHACEEQATRAAAIARSIAPVITGTYRDSIHPEPAEGGARVVADPVNDSGEGYGAYVEVGTSATPAHHTLLTALESVGNTSL
jgi:hypothetical protein